MNVEHPNLTVSGTLDRGMMSLSADTLDSILPVQLEPDQMREYQATFFPPRKAGKGVQAKRQHYPEMYQILGQVSAVVNSVLSLSRFLYMELPHDAAAGASAGLLANRLQRQWDEITGMDSLAPAFAATSVRTALSSAASGQAHVIVPSTRYKDGFDVLYSGVPNGAYGRTSTVFAEKPSAIFQMPAYERDVPEIVRTSDFATLAENLGKAVNMWAFNSDTFVDVAMDDRHVQQVRINQDNWSVSKLQATLDGLMKKAGFAGGFPKIDARIEIPTDLVMGLGDNFSFGVVKEPNHTYLTQKIINKGTGATGEKSVPRLVDVLQAEYGFFIVMNLKPELANFITQAGKGERVSLVSLNTWVNAWSRALLKQRGTKFNKAGKGGDKLTPAVAPRYILRPSGTANVSKRRTELGLYTEKTRANEDNLYINNQGRFNYCPTSEEVVTENAKSYEEKQERALQLSYSVGAPLISSQVGSASNYFAYKSEEYAKNIREAKSDLTAYAGALQTYNWDYNCILTSSRSDPDRLVSISLAGASRPDSLAISEYLKQPFADALLRLFPDNSVSEYKELNTEHLKDTRLLLSSSLFKDLFEAYQYMLYQGTAPDFGTLVERAAKALDYKTLQAGPGQEGQPIEYDLKLYTPDATKAGLTPIIGTDLKPTPQFTLRKFDKAEKLDEQGLKYLKQSLEMQTSGIRMMLERAIGDANGRGMSNLAFLVSRDGGNIEDDPHYFDLAIHNLGDFNRLYNYLGGRVFYEMVQVLLKADIKDLSVVRGGQIPMPSFDSVVRSIKPFATMFGKYVPEQERINDEGDAISESLQKDQSVTMDEIGLPGSTPNFQLFPHQAETFKTLGQEKPPRFAVLDIAPGGGKTALGLTDIGNLIRRGLIKKPVVLCPNGLVRNWIEDMHQFTAGKWNLIPVTTLTYKTWGEERLTEMIAKAPINTIFVVGLSFLRLNTYQIVIGNHTEKVSGTLEFCKKFGFDYVILDESHKAKNARSQTHKAIKQLTVASTVKYVRLATGTLIQTKLTDVVGQAALFGAHIFRTQEEYEQENSVPAGRGSATVFAADTPYRARRQLAKHAAVISFKKKEWAFLLPRPIEAFFFVGLEDTEKDDPEGRAHQLMYRAILNETMEEIRADKKLVTLLQGGDDEDGPDEDDEEISDERLEELLSSGTRPGGMTTGGGDLDESQMAEVEAALRPYLQRLEMGLTDPMGDPSIKKYFEENGLSTNYTSRKVKKIIERVNLNFKEIPWEKGATYKLKDVVDYDGVRYVLMGEPGKKLTLDSYSETYASRLEPKRDPRWKPEPMGKVIVFCRYTRSVNAVLKALPPHLKKLAVGFSGAHSDKWQNLEAFRTTPFSTSKGVQILVANEQAISEGHNLQMASRIVRCESPWSPGELDQSSSRIFRPDTTGKFRRENAYLDWVLCNGTMEVAKLGRIVSRQIDKTKFDEADNPLYDPLAETTLVPISMSLETIAATPNLSDIQEYLDTYEKLVRIQSAEFEEMRQTRPSSMIPIEETEMPEGSSRIEHVPYLPTMKFVPDPHNFGLVKLTTFLQDEEDPQAIEANANKQLLVGQYAHTEFGNGMIVGLREAKNPDGPTKLTSVRVQLANGDEYTADPAMIYLAQNVTKETAAQFTPKNRWTTAADKKKAAREEAARDREQAREERRLERAAAREQREAKRLKKQEAAAKAKKPVKVPKSAKAPKEVEVEEEEENDNLIVELYPVVYGGYLAVEARPGDHEPRELKKLGFKAFGDYAYMQIKDKISFDALLAWLDKKFYLRSETSRRLEKLAESFQSGRGRKFAVEQAPFADFKNFYYISHKLSVKDKASGKPELKIYPVILNGSLFLNVDISTNPVIRKFLNKPIPGTKNLKFQEAESLYIQFFKTRNEVVAWTKKTLASGVEIENLQEFKDSVDALKDKLKVMQKLAK